MRAIAPLVLIGAGVSAHAATLSVNCGASSGLTSINAAIKLVQSNQSMDPATINASGACHENVVIQSIDRLTLNAANGASVSDALGGTLDVISIQDFRDVAVNGFTINAGAGDSINGISCGDYSICRLSRNVIQGATGGGGFAVYSQSQATLDGDTLQDNSSGLIMRSGTKLRATRRFISRNNIDGIDIGRQAFAYITAVIQFRRGNSRAMAVDA